MRREDHLFWDSEKVSAREMARNFIGIERLETKSETNLVSVKQI